MAVRLALLKSGEEVVADIKEARENDTDDVVYYILKNPYRVEIIDSQRQVLNEEGESQTSQKEMYFSPWIPLSKDKEIPVKPDWVVTIVEPYDEVAKTYTEKVGV